MFDFHEKRKIRRVMYSKPLIGFMVLLTLVMLRSVYERYTVEQEMEAKLEARAHELETLRSRAALLEGKVEHLKNERGIEEELRSRFDVVKEGEQVVIIVDDTEATEAEGGDAATPEESVSESFFKKLKFW
jgi:cell division protein FtsB